MSNRLAGNENCDCATKAGFAKAGKRGYRPANQTHRFCAKGTMDDKRCAVCGFTKRHSLHKQSIKPTVTKYQARQTAAVREYQPMSRLNPALVKRFSNPADCLTCDVWPEGCATHNQISANQYR